MEEGERETERKRSCSAGRCTRPRSISQEMTSLARHAIRACSMGEWARFDFWRQGRAHPGLPSHPACNNRGGDSHGPAGAFGGDSGLAMSLRGSPLLMSSVELDHTRVRRREPLGPKSDFLGPPFLGENPVERMSAGKDGACSRGFDGLAGAGDGPCPGGRDGTSLSAAAEAATAVCGSCMMRLF